MDAFEELGLTVLEQSSPESRAPRAGLQRFAGVTSVVLFAAVILFAVIATVSIATSAVGSAELQAEKSGCSLIGCVP